MSWVEGTEKGQREGREVVLVRLEGDGDPGFAGSPGRGCWSESGESSAGKDAGKDTTMALGRSGGRAVGRSGHGYSSLFVRGLGATFGRDEESRRGVHIVRRAVMLLLG